MIAGAALATCLAACSSAAKGGSDGGSDLSSPGACAAITGKMFMSLSQGECGLASDGGLVLCHWHITFSDGGSFYWQHSDYGQTGTYTCDGDAVSGMTNGGGTISGSWDSTRAQLIWDARAYAAAP